MSAKGQDYHDRLTDFMTEFVFPAEASYEAYRGGAVVNFKELKISVPQLP